jgi:hypothetical protein
MRIDSPQSVGIISGFGIPTGGTINQVLSKVDSDNYDTQWTTVSGSSGSTLSFTASSEITKGYAVRLKENGTILKTDYTENGVVANGNIASSPIGRIESSTYVTTTNQTLSLAFSADTPVLLVGTVNPSTRSITYASPLQLSTTGRFGPMQYIHYDSTIDIGLVMYGIGGNQARLISIVRTGSSYSVGTSLNIQFVNEIPIVGRITSNRSNRFYVSSTSNNPSLGVLIKTLTVTSGSITVNNTSPLPPVGTPQSHGLVWYKTDRVALVNYYNGSIGTIIWNTSANTFGSSIGVTSFPSVFNNSLYFNAYNGTGTQDFVAGWVGDQNSNALRYTLTNDTTVNNLSLTRLLFQNGQPFTAQEGVVSLPNTNNLFFTSYNYNGITNQYVTTVGQFNLTGSTSTFWDTDAYSGVFQDTSSNYYALGYDFDNIRTYWDALGIVRFTNLPIIGIAQQSGTTGNMVEVAVENSISTANTGLTPTTNYFMNDNGSLATTGVTYLGYALSDNELNVLFHNPPGSLTTSNWSLSSGYSQNDLVINQRSIYQANSIIPPNTAFAVGTTGTTWSQIGAPIPSGGTTGQILRKVNNTDYNTEWYGLSYASILFNSLNTNANQDQTPVLGPANGITVVGNTMVISRPGIYSLNANLAFRAGFVEYRWVDSSNTQLVGTNVGVTGSLTSTEAVSPSPAAGIVNITSPNTVIKLRNGNVSAIGTQVPGYAIATITQIA